MMRVRRNTRLNGQARLGCLQNVGRAPPRETKVYSDEGRMASCCLQSGAAVRRMISAGVQTILSRYRPNQRAQRQRRLHNQDPSNAR